MHSVTNCHAEACTFRLHHGCTQQLRRTGCKHYGYVASAHRWELRAEVQLTRDCDGDRHTRLVLTNFHVNHSPLCGREQCCCPPTIPSHPHNIEGCAQHRCQPREPRRRYRHT